MKVPLAIVLAASLVALPTSAALPDPGLPTPCNPMLLDFACTIWQGVFRAVGKVCAKTPFGCPQSGALLP